MQGKFGFLIPFVIFYKQGAELYTKSVLSVKIIKAMDPERFDQFAVYSKD